MYARQASKSGGSFTIHSKAFGEPVTVDHIITRDAKDNDFQKETVSHVVMGVNLGTFILRPQSQVRSPTKIYCTSWQVTMRLN